MKRGKIEFWSTILVSVLIAFNVFLNDGRCWGLQPGGRLSAGLFACQIIIGSWVALRIVYKMYTRSVRLSEYGLFFLMAATLWLAGLTGRRIFTSQHYQGNENLVFFGLAVVSTVVGIVILNRR